MPEDTITIEVVKLATKAPKKNVGPVDKWGTKPYRPEMMALLKKLEPGQGFIISGAPDSVLYDFVCNARNRLKDQEGVSVGLKREVIEPGKLRFWIK